jgi:hypothetical protein
MGDRSLRRIPQMETMYKGITLSVTEITSCVNGFTIFSHTEFSMFYLPFKRDGKPQGYVIFFLTGKAIRFIILACN